MFGVALTVPTLTMQLTSGVNVFRHVCRQKGDTSSNYCDNIQPCDKRRFSFCRAMRCISTAYAVMRCVCVSVTFVRCIKTNKDIFEIFSPSGSKANLVLPCQTEWRYSDGNPHNGGVECRRGRQKTRFWTNIWLRCIPIYSVINRTSREV